MSQYDEIEDLARRGRAAHDLVMIPDDAPASTTAYALPALVAGIPGGALSALALYGLSRWVCRAAYAREEAWATTQLGFPVDGWPSSLHKLDGTEVSIFVQFRSPPSDHRLVEACRALGGDGLTVALDGAQLTVSHSALRAYGTNRALRGLVHRLVERVLLRIVGRDEIALLAVR